MPRSKIPQHTTFFNWKIPQAGLAGTGKQVRVIPRPPHAALDANEREHNVPETVPETILMVVFLNKTTIT